MAKTITVPSPAERTTPVSEISVVRISLLYVWHDSPLLEEIPT